MGDLLFWLSVVGGVLIALVVIGRFLGSSADEVTSGSDVGMDDIDWRETGSGSDAPASAPPEASAPQSRVPPVASMPPPPETTQLNIDAGKGAASPSGAASPGSVAAPTVAGPPSLGPGSKLSAPNDGPAIPGLGSSGGGGAPTTGKPELAAIGPREYRVWFGTNRAPNDPNDLSKGFSGRREPEKKKIHYGHCDVVVPEAHKVGSTGDSTWFSRLVTGVDDRLRVKLIAGLERDDYWRAVADQLAKADKGKRQALIFIHGYKNTFEDAAIRAAQIGFDLGIQGAMAFFSWASRGSAKPRGYTADEATIGWSVPAIADFIADFASKTDAEQVHIIAHSMGNRGLLGAVNRLAFDAARRQHCRFGQIILAAADVDAGEFVELAEAYRAVAEKRTTLYVSERDKAVELSEWLHDFDRAGFAPPFSIVPDIETVSVTGVDMTLLGHGYVAEARPVLEDMGELIHYGTRAAGRHRRLDERQDGDGRTYWAIRA